MKRKKYTFDNLPKPGDTFQFVLPNGLFGICRVLRKTTESELKFMGAPYVVVVTSSWLGKEPPNLENNSLRDYLYLTHHSHKNTPKMSWVSTPPDENYQYIGNIKPSKEDETVECYESGGWSFVLQANLQWKWDNEPREVDSESTDLEPSTPIRPKSQKELLEDSELKTWLGNVPPQAHDKTTKILLDTIRKIFKVKDNNKVKKYVIKCIEDINILDDKYSFIETIEREDLFELLSDLLLSAGIDSPEDIIDEYREW